MWRRCTPGPPTPPTVRAPAAMPKGTGTPHDPHAVEASQIDSQPGRQLAVPSPAAGEPPCMPRCLQPPPSTPCAASASLPMRWVGGRGAGSAALAGSASLVSIRQQSCVYWVPCRCAAAATPACLALPQPLTVVPTCAGTAPARNQSHEHRCRQCEPYWHGRADKQAG